MKIAKLDQMIGGWFIGDFEPNIVRTKDFEVGIKYYKRGDKEPLHVHKIGSEITVIESGKVIMMDTVINAGEIIMLSPGDATSFEALEDTTTIVIKFPSVIGDKYILKEDA